MKQWEQFCKLSFFKIKTIFTNSSIQKAIIFLATLDLLFFALHLNFSYYTFFNLDAENNLPTVYQGLKTVFFGFYMVFCYGEIAKTYFSKLWQKASYLVTSWSFIYLGVDEMSQIHENVPTYIFEFFPNFAFWYESLVRSFGYQGTAWLLYYLPFAFVFIAPFLLLFLWLIRRQRESFILFLASFVYFLLVIVLEMITTTGDLTPEIYIVAVAWEELFEMLGVTFLGCGTYMYVHSHKSTAKNNG